MPQITTAYVRGRVRPLPLNKRYDNPVPYGQDNVQLPTVGPGPLPADPFEPIPFLDYLQVQMFEAATLGWIPDPHFFAHEMAAVRSGLGSGNAWPAIGAFLAAVEQAEIDPNARELLRPNLEFLRSQVAPNTGTVIVPVARDSTLRSREPHRNEGANPALALMKITGKPARPVVAFDLDGYDTTGLVSATLILTVDLAQSPTGWGNGRTVSVRRLMQGWEEGNGRDFDLPGSLQTPGSGAGVTWFSPVDSNIGNGSPDSSQSWEGAEMAADAPTAAGVTITNHSSGEVAFDVMADVLHGAEHGWLVVRDHENAGSKVRFYSREGASMAGDSELAPRLVLDYGGAAAHSTPIASAVRLMARPVRETELGSRALPRSVLVEECLALAAQPLPFGTLAGVTLRLLCRLLPGTA